MSIIVGKCGLVCSKCSAFVRGKCLGCLSGKQAFKSCGVRKCAETKNIPNCSGCGDYPDLKQCGKLNSFISKIIGLMSDSNRLGNLNRIREAGLQKFEEESAE
jgi:hypothetical protein